MITPTKEPQKEIHQKNKSKSNDGAHYPLEVEKKIAPNRPILVTIALAALLTLGAFGVKRFSNNANIVENKIAAEITKTESTVKNILDASDEYMNATEQNQDQSTIEQKKQKFILAATNLKKNPSVDKDQNAIQDLSGTTIVSKCYIGGHDIHYLSLDGRILSHVTVDTPLSGMLARAREVITLNPGLPTKILVSKDRLQIYNSKGELVREEVAQDKK